MIDWSKTISRFVFRSLPLVIVLVMALASHSVAAQPVHITVNAPDGPMPKFLEAVRDAATAGQTDVIVDLENTSLLDNPELLELVTLEITEILAKHDFAGEHGLIMKCPLKCNPDPEPIDDGSVVILKVNAPDGPMPPFLKALQDARAQNVFRVVVQVENASVLNDPELLELVLLEVKELLEKFNYKSRNSEIVQCAAAC